ncbi:dna polymerase alpha catalytic [Nannochloropsis oceanica]
MAERPRREKVVTAADLKRKSDRENLKAAREGKKSRLDSLVIEEEDNVYDVMDEDEYEDLVRKRRQREDFVVDDEGLGYYDDGEEHAYEKEEEQQQRNLAEKAARKKTGVSTISAEALRKARRLGQLSEGVSKGGAGAKEGLFKYVQRAGASVGPATAGGGGGGGGAGKSKSTILQDDSSASAIGRGSKAAAKRKGEPGGTFEAELESQLNDLISDGGGGEGREGGSTYSSASRRPIATPLMAGGTRPLARPRPMLSGPKRLKYRQQRASMGSLPGRRPAGGGGGGDYGDDDLDMREHAMEFDGLLAEQQQQQQQQQQGEQEGGAGRGEVRAVPVASAKAKSRFQRQKKAIEAAMPAPMGTLSEAPQPIDPMTGVKVEGLEAARGGEEDEEEDPYSISSVTNSAAPGAKTATGSVKWETVAKQEEDGMEYVPFFWIDAHEQNGILYLFGKVAVEEGNFVSAACCVHGMQNSLLVLPKRTGNAGPDGKDVRYGMADVYKEVQDLLIPSVIPCGAGQGFKCKPVRRKYAFELEEIPREETEYLKVVYSAQHGLPSPERCESGGRYFERVFGSRTTALERFLLKRQLMGPGWLKVHSPRPASSSATIAKFEFVVDDPKLVRRLEAPPPAPPVVVMSVAIKTVVNPASQLHEVVAISTMTHTGVNCDGPTETGPQHIRQVTAVRPLGGSAGPGHPAAFPHDMAREVEAQSRKTRIQTQGNERALLSWFFQRLQTEDPDMIVGHNLLGFELEVLLVRATALKVSVWHKIGRLRRSKFPNPKGLARDINLFGLTAGRLMADTYLTAREHLRETNYSLGNLAATQLRLLHPRAQIDPLQVPAFFGSSKLIVNLAQHTAFDAQLVQRLCLRLQLVPLTKQLTNISGNLWARTIKGNRAERIEYLLLHEFHNLKYVTPERHAFGARDPSKEQQGGGKGGSKKAGAAQTAATMDHDIPEEDEHPSGGPGGAGQRATRGRQKPAYAGGLVLEPKKGLYDSYILLLDFNSLYPSIIQEYNMCFTTINWSTFASNSSTGGTGPTAIKRTGVEDEEGGEEDDSAAAGAVLPPLPDTALEQGVLPRVIKTLVDRRSSVKKLLKGEKDAAKREQLDIRQKALKLTANSMYGCLGFSHSRFFARPIAALVTAMGRETLQRTVDVAQNQLSLDVIYGDTDSIMINTTVASRDEFDGGLGGEGEDNPAARKARLEQDLERIREVKAKGSLVKQAVNKLYKSLELEVDGIFKCMLLLKKKKYAALTVTETPEGTLAYAKELKGLDLVRRDWCVLSKETGRFVIDQILSGENRDAVVATIHTYLEELAKRMRAGEIDVRQYAITKGLNKAPHEYPDAKSQPHLQVALAMMKAGKPVNVGDHIEYVICEKEGAKAAAERAFHPDDVQRSEGELKVDVEWYLTQQILPPISRLCEPIEGTSVAILAERLGLDKSRFGGGGNGGAHGNDDEAWGFTPMCKMEDSERFMGCDALKLRCTSCSQEADFAGVFYAAPAAATTEDGSSSSGSAGKTAVGLHSGLLCPNPECQALYWGAPNAASCFARLFNRVTLTVRQHVKKYYDCWLLCDDSGCKRRTRQQSVLATACLARGCHGHMDMEYSEKQLHTQLKFLETLFDVKRAKSKKIAAGVVPVPLPDGHIRVLDLLHDQTRQMVSSTAYNWIRPSLWSMVFSGVKQQGQ